VQLQQLPFAEGSLRHMILTAVQCLENDKHVTRVDPARPSFVVLLCTSLSHCSICRAACKGSLGLVLVLAACFAKVLMQGIGHLLSSCSVVLWAGPAGCLQLAVVASPHGLLRQNWYWALAAGIMAGCTRMCVSSWCSLLTMP
jgi:hypothetical protein